MDAREARTNVGALTSLRKLIGGSLEVEMLESGDFASTDTPLTLGIEHKTFGDLVGSMSSNRLDKQLSLLVDSYDVPVLLVDDVPAARGGKLAIYGARRSVSLNWVMGSVFGWALRGVIPLMVRTPAMVGPTVASLYATVSKGEHRSTYEPVKLLDNLHEMTLTERVAVQLPGIGPERAAKFADKTPAELTALTEAVWKEWLGPLTGARGYAAWHGGTNDRSPGNPRLSDKTGRPHQPPHRPRPLHSTPKA
jgi:ERCC4-type nuclease